MKSANKTGKRREPKSAGLPKSLRHFLALIEADRWLSFASVGVSDDMRLHAEIERVRRDIGRRLVRLQGSAYVAWSKEIAKRHMPRRRD